MSLVILLSSPLSSGPSTSPCKSASCMDSGEAGSLSIRPSASLPGEMPSFACMLLGLLWSGVVTGAATGGDR